MLYNNGDNTESELPEGTYSILILQEKCSK